MKRRFIQYNRKIQIMLVLAVIVILSSCLKNSGPIQDFSQTPALVSIQGDGNYTGIFVDTSHILYSATPSVKTIEVTLSVPSLTLSSPVSATVVVDTATLNAYNAANSDNKILLPASTYQLANNGAVTIPAGKYMVKVPITFMGNKIDSTQNYGLPLLLTNASGAKIPSNLKQEVIGITVSQH